MVDEPETAGFLNDDMGSTDVFKNFFRHDLKSKNNSASEQLDKNFNSHADEVLG